VNKEIYVDIFLRLKDAVRGNRTEKMENQQLFLLHDNAPAHRSILVKDFLSKNSVTTLEHPPNNPDLGPATFYLFPRQKPALKGRRLCDATDIINNTTKELKRFS
jgi:transposase